jgi:hypothetical protein
MARLAPNEDGHGMSCQTAVLAWLASGSAGMI